MSDDAELARGVVEYSMRDASVEHHWYDGTVALIIVAVA